MILEAAREFGIDLAASIMIGDGARDIVSARAAGVGRTLRIADGNAADRMDGPPDAVVATVADAEAWFAHHTAAGA